jgi:hypothetical protein
MSDHKNRIIQQSGNFGVGVNEGTIHTVNMPIKGSSDQAPSVSQTHTSKEPVDHKRQQQETRQVHLHSEWTLRSEKLAVLRHALVLETSADRKFQLEKQIQTEQTEIERLERELCEIEQALKR